MKNILLTLLLVILAQPVFANPEIGQPAPDFTLQDVRTEEQISLSDFKGQVVVLQLMKCN